jgi:hypothetical protein
MFDKWYIGNCVDCGVGGLHVTNIDGNDYCQDCKCEAAFPIVMRQVKELEAQLAERDAQLTKLVRFWNDDYANVFDTPFSRQMDKMAEREAKEAAR